MVFSFLRHVTDPVRHGLVRQRTGSSPSAAICAAACAVRRNAEFYAGFSAQAVCHIVRDIHADCAHSTVPFTSPIGPCCVLAVAGLPLLSTAAGLSMTLLAASRPFRAMPVGEREGTDTATPRTSHGVRSDQNFEANPAVAPAF